MGKRTGGLKENMEEDQNEGKWDGEKDDVFYVFFYLLPETFIMFRIYGMEVYNKVSTFRCSLF